MNKLDKQYTDLLQDIIDNGITKQDRTGTGTKSIFGYQIRHNMKDGFPLLTTKKMAWKSIVTELLWFLRGDTNIKYLVDNGCHIWDGDAYKAYEKAYEKDNSVGLSLLVARTDGKRDYRKPTKEQFIGMIETDNEFAKKWGELGKIYGFQWRSWGEWSTIDVPKKVLKPGIDQIANLINDLKTNPDSRRLLVSAWNPSELDQMVLPPCHYGFQVYTRELSLEERHKLALPIWKEKYGPLANMMVPTNVDNTPYKIPTRAISLMWNQRSVDTFLGLPFNIASYGLLLEIIAKATNMVPDELIGNLGDVHLYSNHIEQAKEQIGRVLSLTERREMVTQEMFNQIYTAGDSSTLSHPEIDQWDIPRIKTREPYPLPTLNINTEFWPTEGGECGVGPLDAVAVFNSFQDDNFCKCLLEEDIQLSNYQSHPTIKAPLSN